VGAIQRFAKDYIATRFCASLGLVGIALEKAQLDPCPARARFRQQRRQGMLCIDRILVDLDQDRTQPKESIAIAEADLREPEDLGEKRGGPLSIPN
jgi:hypothetical protein